jgi:hypothetical protein
MWRWCGRDGDGGVAKGTSISTSRRRKRGTTIVRRGRTCGEPWHDHRPAWADVRLRQFLAEGHGRGGRFTAAVKRLLDCSFGRVDAAIDDLLRAWYKDRV